MTSNSLRIGTRGSALARKQTDVAIAELERANADAAFEVVTITTTGDKDKERPFEEIGPHGVFADELQRALHHGDIDVAVHSLKDLPSKEPGGLVLSAVLERGDPRDVLVSRDDKSLEDLPSGAVVGTSSARRTALVLHHRPDLRTSPMRGNVDTRLTKVADGDFDAAVLAAAGIMRLQREQVITEFLDPEWFVPPPGQGAIVVEARADRSANDLSWLARADHPPTRAAIEAERIFMAAIEGGCDVPLGAWARFEGDDIVLDGFMATVDGSSCLRERAFGRDPVVLGTELAERMIGVWAGNR